MLISKLFTFLPHDLGLGLVSAFSKGLIGKVGSSFRPFFMISGSFDEFLPLLLEEDVEEDELDDALEIDEIESFLSRASFFSEIELFPCNLPSLGFSTDIVRL